MKNKLLKTVLGRRYRLADNANGLVDGMALLVKDYEDQETMAFLLARKTWLDVRDQVEVGRNGWGSRRKKAIEFLRSLSLKESPFVVDVMMLDVPDKTYRAIDVEDLVGLEQGEFARILYRLKRGQVYGWMDVKALDVIVRNHWPLPPTLVDYLMVDGPIIFAQHVEQIGKINLTDREKEILREFTGVPESFVYVSFQIRRQYLHGIKVKLFQELGLYGRVDTGYLRRILRQPDVVAWRAFLCGEPLGDVGGEKHNWLTLDRMAVLEQALT